MKKITVWMALLAFCGTNNPVTAVESSQGLNTSSHTVSINKKYWTVDRANQTITNSDLLQDGSQFDSDTLLKIFNDLAAVVKKNYKGYKIRLSNLFLSGYLGETIDLSPIAKHIHSIGQYFLYKAHHLTDFKTENLISLKRIEDYFLNNVYSMKRLDTQVFINVKEIGDGFLSGAISLEEFNAQGLINVKKVGKNFLNHAPTNFIVVPSSHYTMPLLHNTLPSSSLLSIALKKALNNFLSSPLKRKVVIMSIHPDSPKTEHLKKPQRVAGLPHSNVEDNEKNSNKIRIKINVKKRTKKESDKNQESLDKSINLCGNQKSARNNAPENVFIDTKEELNQAESIEKNSKKNSLALADNSSVIDDESMEKN